jgi:hypothetical protein
MSTLFYGFRPNYAPAVTVASLVLFCGGRRGVSRTRAPRVNPMTALQHD